MSRTFHHGDRRIRVKGVRRQPADLRRLAKALIALAQADAEAAAAAEHSALAEKATTKSAQTPGAPDRRPS